MLFYIYYLIYGFFIDYLVFLDNEYISSWFYWSSIDKKTLDFIIYDMII